MILLQALIALSAQFSLAHANPATMADFTGTYAVKDCQFTENYSPNPKDYYCRITELRVTAKDAATYEIAFTDELGQKQHDIDMAEFKQEQKDGTVITGAFTNTDNSSIYTVSRQNPDSSTNGETRGFTVDPQSGVVTLDRTVTASTNDSYKSAEWIYQLKKK